MVDGRMRSLNALLRVRKTEEDNAKEAYMAARRQVDLKENEKNEALKRIAFEEKMSQTSLELHSAFLRWVPAAQENIEDIKRQIATLVEKLTPKREAMAQAGVARKSVEELIAKRQEMIDYAQRQKTQREVDDLASRQFFDKNLKRGG